MSDLLSQLRAACARVSERARYIAIQGDLIARYADQVGAEACSSAPGPEHEAHLTTGTREELAAFWLTLDAINFGSGWFPTLRKLPGRTGYYTIAAGVRERFARAGPWSAQELAELRAEEIAEALGQDPNHELMGLFVSSLNDLGAHLAAGFDGRFEALVDSAGGSAVALVEGLASWECFTDASSYEGVNIPFLKRAQIAAADLARAGVAAFGDLDRLTMFADNLVPHVLRMDGVLTFEPQLVARIERGELVDHGSPEEVEIRACAVHAVELIVARHPGRCAAEIDQVLWQRGQERRYKVSPRHRSRCTAY